MVATDVLLLLQAPPDTVSVSAAGVEEHSADTPEIVPALNDPDTVTVVVV